MGITHNFLGLASHVAVGWIIGRTFATPHAMPLLAVLFGMQGAIEHYPQKFYAFAKANAPLTLIGLVVNVYWFYNLFSVSAAPGWVIWSGIAFFIALIGVAKTMDMGLPKDTVDEQIEALKSNPNYDRDHLMIHIALTLIFGFLSFTCPGQDIWNEPLINIQSLLVGTSLLTCVDAVLMLVACSVFILVGIAVRGHRFNCIGLAAHAVAGWLVGRTFTMPCATPFLVVLFGMHGAIEHYPDKLYAFTKANVPLTLMSLVVNIYWFYNLFSVSAAPGWVIWIGIASFIGVIGFAKVTDTGLPKDTVDEQIEALKSNPNYDREHLMVHIVLTLIFGFLSFTCSFPSEACSVPAVAVGGACLCCFTLVQLLAPVASTALNHQEVRHVEGRCLLGCEGNVYTNKIKCA